MKHYTYNDFKQAVETVLKQTLIPDARLILTLYYADGLSDAEIGKITCLGQGNIADARQALIDEIKEELENYGAIVAAEAAC